MAKKYVTVMIAFLTVVISSLATCQQISKVRFVYIEYIGPSDKYLPPILIGNSKNGAQWYLSKVLKRSDLYFTEASILKGSLVEAEITLAERYRELAQQDDAKAKSAKTISVVLVTPREEEKFLLSIRNASSMLEDFKRICKGKKRVLSDMSYFQTRILAYEVGGAPS